MRILIVNDYHERGGCEVLARLGAEGFAARGHDVAWFVPEPESWRPGPIGYVDSRANRRGLRAKLDAFAPDVVHLHNFYHRLSPGILAALASWKRATGGRVVMTAHDFHLACPNSGLRFFRGGAPHLAEPDRLVNLGYVLARRWDHRGLAHATLKLAQHVWNYRMHDRRRAIDAIVCPSRFMARVLDVHGLPTVVVPSPAPPVRDVAPREVAPLRLVFAGRLEPEKGVAEFIDAMPRDFAGRFEVIGDGAERDRAQRCAEARGLADRIDFVGVKPHAAVLERLAAAHAVVLPSRWYENQPLSLLEAIAAGAELLVSNLGGMQELVDDLGAGETFDPFDPPTITAAVERLTQRHARGELNRYDAGDVLRERTEARYVERLLEVQGTSTTFPH